ncbi:ABC transporter family substrate-binding protein [Arthrobacter psychrochitiniphilus]|uniref:ABC transporter substrate-binding protein n=1 Tax=Arthrobacter psychrochitiniphilus TaxID=291045 RepID=A0A2V3DPR6_9MICC|nr:ABC transporter family substrate-binding protein [Arthrobacter psychrochitiniphilus]NYG18535.1 peptide/nickel transport system substrate-binding protein [Arthrobacter psychrochitiniphilus]PXA64346.1 ABC transporter substrate-binding protein [Arthrobacter psychrochitiniphilus]
MRLGRIFKVLTAAAALALTLSACTGTEPVPNESSASPTVTVGGNVTVLESTPFSSFNSSSVTGGSATNTRIEAATHSGFNTVDSDLLIVKNEKFGKYEKVKDKPLTIKYTINDGVQWSDGEPVTADDLMLQWAALSGWYNDAVLDGNFSVTSGTAYFHSAGDHSGLAQTERPVISDDRKSLTLTYTTAFSDWETALGSTVSIPAHIVAVRAGLADAPALSSVLESVQQGDPTKQIPPNPTLRKVADFWNTGFDTRSMPNPSLALSNGPFLVKGITKDKELILTRNADYTWGDAPNLDTLTVQYESDPDKQVAALAAGTADVISPPMTAERSSALEALTSSGVKIQQGQGLGFDQMVLNFEGVFAPLEIRQAFLHTVPRQDIIDQVAAPLDPQAEVLNSFVFRPVEVPYKESSGSNGSKLFAPDGVDPDGFIAAKELLDGAKPTVRVLYNRDDPERLAEYQLVAASAAKAGFTVMDAGKSSKEWMAALRAGAFDVALYGWTSNPTGSDQVPQIFRTAAPSNFNNFSNTVVDQLTEQLAVNPDGAKQNALKMQIDKLVMDAGYGLPLFQRSTLSATGKHVSGVTHSPLAIGPWESIAHWVYVK